MIAPRMTPETLLLSQPCDTWCNSFERGIWNNDSMDFFSQRNQSTC